MWILCTTLATMHQCCLALLSLAVAVTFIKGVWQKHRFPDTSSCSQAYALSCFHEYSLLTTVP